MLNFRLEYIFFYISNLVAKAPGLNLGEKVSNLLSDHEALNQQSKLFIFVCSQNNGLDKFMCPKGKNFLKVSKQKEQIQYRTTQNNNYKKALLVLSL